VLYIYQGNSPFYITRIISKTAHAFFHLTPASPERRGAVAWLDFQIIALIEEPEE
jgi:hypothetical protein